MRVRRRRRLRCWLEAGEEPVGAGWLGALGLGGGCVGEAEEEEGYSGDAEGQLRHK
jgi:hypothetical protein